MIASQYDLLDVFRQAMEIRWTQHGLTSSNSPYSTLELELLGHKHNNQPELGPILRFTRGQEKPALTYSVIALLDLSREPLERDTDALFDQISDIALYIRARLPRKEDAEELGVWIIGPQGSDESLEWIVLLQRVLHDQMVCPKHLWLPPSADARFINSIDKFLDQTFLARPWIPSGDKPMADSPTSLTLTAMAQKAGLTTEQANLLVHLLFNDDSSQDHAERVKPIIAWILDHSNEVRK
jgi:hypothetical protein